MKRTLKTNQSAESNIDECCEFLDQRKIRYSVTPCKKRIQIEHGGGVVDYFVDGGFWMSRVTAKKGNGLESFSDLAESSFINRTKSSSK